MTTAHSQQHWVLPKADHAAIRQLAAEAGVPPVIAQLLLNRNISTPDAVSRFLSPGKNTLSDPFTLTDMDVAVSRLEQAKANNEHVHVFGDYDVDGVSATAILTHGLNRFGINETSYGLPHRQIDGYGLNADHFGIGDNFDVRIPCTFDKLGRLDAHGAVITGECFVQL